MQFYEDLGHFCGNKFRLVAIDVNKIVICVTSETYDCIEMIDMKSRPLKTIHNMDVYIYTYLYIHTSNLLSIDAANHNMNLAPQGL